jgi:pimeloyl-ACP methyl ester carboxylesterase
MKKVLLAVAGVIVLGIAGFYMVRNPENATLDDSARKGAPGRFVHLSDGVTHYKIDGPDSGRVIVLAHGFSVPLYIWDSTAAHLSAAGYRVIRYDAFGRGWSDRPDVPYDDKLYERQLGELLDSLHIAGKVDFGGVSYGGYATGVYTGRHPDRVRSLILIDPVAGTTPATMHPIDLAVIGPYMFQTMAVPKMDEGQASDFIDPARFPDWASRYRVQMKYKGFGRALRSTQLARRGMDTDTLYKRVAAGNFPVLLIWGVKDQTVPFERNALVRKAIPNAEFHAMEGSAHLPILEQAAQTDSIILAFLHRPERERSSVSPVKGR